MAKKICLVTSFVGLINNLSVPYSKTVFLFAYGGLLLDGTNHGGWVIGALRLEQSSNRSSMLSMGQISLIPTKNHKKQLFSHMDEK